MVLAVIPAKKVLTEDAGVLDRAETIGKLRSVLESFELTFGVGIVIRDMRPTVRLGDSQVRQQEGNRLGGHRGSAIGVEVELAGHDELLVAGVADHFLTPERHIKRKLIEILITFQLEHRFGKKQIFEMYANQVPMGQLGSFAINGFGEASEAYFGKDMRQLSLSEGALLAGLIQSPSRLNPSRHPARARGPRPMVWDAMFEPGEIKKARAEHPKANPLPLAQASV